jgi:putative Mn2+ efflux pump MntP
MLAIAAIAFGMSADAFAAALGKGAALARCRTIEALRTGAIFGLVEMAITLLGWAAGLAASTYVASVDHWVAFGLLGVLGLRMIYGSATRNPAAERPHRHSFLTLAATAIGTSIDALIVGITLAVLDADILTTAIAIGAATFLMTAIGTKLGRFAGARLGSWAEAAGGVVLIAIGTAILIEHLGLLSGV